MTLVTTIAFILVSFMVIAIIMKLGVLIWTAMVGENDRYYYEREFWDEDNDILEIREITADTMEAMKSRITPIEIIDDREAAYEQG